jgi:hypothetical protein
MSKLFPLFGKIILVGMLTAVGCKAPQPTPSAYDSANYLFLVEDAAKNCYYTNDYKQVTATCITFMAQDSIPKKVCGNYTISLLRY